MGVLKDELGKAFIRDDDQEHREQCDLVIFFSQKLGVAVREQGYYRALFAPSSIALRVLSVIPTIWLGATELETGNEHMGRVSISLRVLGEVGSQASPRMWTRSSC